AWVIGRFRPAHGMLDIRDDETRLARWAKLVHKSTDYATLESGIRGEHFVCQPYVKDTNHFIAHLVYKTTWSIEKIDNEELDSFARCVRVSKLVWLDISQQYFPHRVSKQFGYNQDIPADVLHLESNEDAWADYATPLENEYIYLPSRQFEGHVTVRYEEWWKSEPIAIHQDNRVLLPL
ncbi:protein maintenance of meristems, partial [Tanacetum coccineum]